MQPGERHAPDWKTLFLCKTILVFRVACGPLPGCIDPGARPPPPEGFAAGLSVALFRKAGRVMSKVPEAKTA